MIWSSWIDLCACSSPDGGAHEDEPNPSRLPSVCNSEAPAARDVADVYMQRWRDAQGIFAARRIVILGICLASRAPALLQMLCGTNVVLNSERGKLLFAQFA